MDAEERRRLVAEAIFTVVVRDGLAHASLRVIAQEAGLAIGSVRHYFTDSGEMIVFALTRSAERGGLADHVDVPTETERLTALLDGLMTNGVIQPDRMTPDLMRRILDAHLDSIAKN